MRLDQRLWPPPCRLLSAPRTAKKLWLKPLHRHARVLLNALDLPAAYVTGVNAQSPDRALPLKAAQINSLSAALGAVPDPRAANRVFPCASLLTLVALALLAGRQSLAAIQRFGAFLTQAQRAQLGWPYKPGTRFRKAPSYTALYNLLTQLDPHRLRAKPSINGSKPTTARCPAPWPRTANKSPIKSSPSA